MVRISLPLCILLNDIQHACLQYYTPIYNDQILLHNSYIT